MARDPDQPSARAEQNKAQRRRRNSEGLAGRRWRLKVNEDALDRHKYAYRFVSDTEGRVHDLTVNDDWEVVPDADNQIRPDGLGMGSEVAIAAGSDRHGKPLRQVLLRKPKEYHDEDQRAKARAIDETEQAMVGGNIPGAASSEIQNDFRIGHLDRR